MTADDEGVCVRPAVLESRGRAGPAQAPVCIGEFRPGEMRHLTSDIARISRIGFTPEINLDAGIQHYLDWIRQHGPVQEYFAAAEQRLRTNGIVQRAAGAAAGGA